MDERTTIAALERRLAESETQHRRLIDSWAQAVWETNANGLVTADSPSWRAYTGQTLDEWLGHGWLDAIHPDDRAYAERQWREAVTARGLIDAEFRLRAPGGGWRWTNVRAAPVLDAHGEVEKWAGMNIDIHARKCTEAALRESEERFRALFASSPAPFVVISPDAPHFTITDVNEAYLSAMLRTRDEVVGRGLFDAFPNNPGDPTIAGEEDLRASLERVLATRLPDELPAFRYDIARRDGSFEERWWRPVTSPLLDANGEVDAIVHNPNDVTAERRADAALRESEERQAFLLSLSDALRAEPDVDAVANRAVKMMFDRLRVDRCYITFYRPADDAADFPYQIGNETVPPLPSTIRLSDFPDAYEQVLEKTYVIGDDFERRGLSNAERTNSKALGMRAMLASTVRRGEKNPVCSMVAASSTQRHWSPAEIALVEEAAERTWAAIERARAEAALRESEARYRSAARIGRTGSWEADFAAGVRRWSPEGMALFGLDLPDGKGRAGGEGDEWLASLHPDDRDVLARIRAGLERDDRLTVDYRIVRSDGRVAWLQGHAEVVARDAEGRVARLLNVAADITERRSAEQGLRDSDERFAQFAASSSDALWVRDAATLAMEYVSPAIQPIYGVGPKDFLGDVERWLTVILPEDRETALVHLEQAKAGGAVVHEFRIRRQADGEERWIRNTDFPLYDAHGRVQRIGGIAEDVTDARKAFERQGVLTAELQHRTRNLMGLVRSVADKTMARSADLSDFRRRFVDRLNALARVQGLLSRLDEWDRVTFGELIRSELSALNGDSDRVTLTGPDGIALRSSTVQTFALAMHELATNALKYGALAQPKGRLAIAWRLDRAARDGRPWLHVDWRESGVAMPAGGAPPRGGGSGRELIERALPYQLGARTTFVMERDGVHCTIALPVSERQSRQELTNA